MGAVAGEVAPDPVLLILHVFHVKHRIWEVANALYGERTPPREEVTVQAPEMLDHLDHSGDGTDNEFWM